MIFNRQSFSSTKAFKFSLCSLFFSKSGSSTSLLLIVEAIDASDEADFSLLHVNVGESEGVLEDFPNGLNAPFAWKVYRKSTSTLGIERRLKELLSE